MTEHKYIDTSLLKYPNIAIFDMKLHGVLVPMVRLLDLTDMFPPADVVTRDCYDRILWENDIMRKQLSEIGKSFGGKMDDVQKVVCGQWEWNDHNGYYYCSNCNAVSPREDQEGEYCDTPLYCPRCGAKMDLE